MNNLPAAFRLSLLTAAMALLGACGGGSSDDGKAEPKVTVEITAIDGYIQNATAWLEQDGDGVADNDEKQATTNAQGKATFAEMDADNYQAWVRVYKGVSSDTGDGSATPVLFDREFVLTAPTGQRILSPFTTLIALKMQSQPALSVAEAAAAVAQSLALPAASADALLGDFMASGDKRLQLYANKLITAMPLVAPTTVQGDAILAEGEQIGEALSALLSDDEALSSITDFTHIKLIAQDDGSIKAISDRDGDGIADADDAFPDDAEKSEAPNITTGTVVIIRDLGYGLGEQPLSVDYTTVSSVFFDGTTEEHTTRTIYYWDLDAQDYVYLDGEKLVHERSEETIWEPVNLTSNSESTRVIRWQRDFNRDNKLELHGQSYTETLLFDFGESHWEYIDAADPAIEGIDDGVDRSAYRFDGGDIKAAVLAGDFSDLERIEHYLSAAHAEDVTKRWSVYEGEALVDFDKDKSTPSELLEQKFSTDHVDVLIASREVFTDSDGTLVERTQKPVLASLAGVDAYGYADYTSLDRYVPQNSQGYGDYWFEFETRTATVAGKEVVINSSQRYLLDAETGGKLITAEAPQGVLFKQYESRKTQVSADETTLWSSWKHLHLPGYAFTLDSDNEGQNYDIYRKDANDLWVGHRFAEWGSRDVTDLAAKVELLRSENVALDEISALNLLGLDEYNSPLLSPSFQYDAAGKARTWYWLTRLDVSNSVNNWYNDYQKLVITLTDNGLPEGFGSSAIREASGVIFFYVQKDSAPDGYRSFAFGVWPSDNSEYGIDASNGYWNMWGGHFYLDEAAADAKLAELNGNVQQ